MKALELRLRNFKRIKALSITLDPNDPLVIVRGRNSQGKSSVIDSIWAALGGKACSPDQPIRHGEDKAQIYLDLGEYTVTRTFTESGTSLSVKTKDGASITRAQELLDKLIGSVSFDPLSFARMKPRDQIVVLSGITGVDFSVLNQKRSTLYNERTVVNRMIGTIRAERGKVAELIPPNTDPADYMEKLDTSAVISDMNARNAKEVQFARARDALDSCGVQIEMKKAEIQRLWDQLSIARADLEKMVEKFDSDTLQLEVLRADLPTATDGDYQSMLRDIARHNNTVDNLKSLADVEARLAASEAESQSLTNQISAIDARKADLIASKKMPIESLSFDEDGVYYKDTLFQQCSSSEQLRVSTAIAMATNPTIRIIRIADGSLLDADSMKELAVAAAANDCQIWIERVDDNEKGPGILIEDGEVVSDASQ